MKIKPILWEDETPPNHQCSYTHAIGHSPLGEFLITWKDWKEEHDYSVDVSPVGYVNGKDTLEKTKNMLDEKYKDLILSCLEI